MKFLRKYAALKISQGYFAYLACNLVTHGLFFLWGLFCCDTDPAWGRLLSSQTTQHMADPYSLHMPALCSKTIPGDKRESHLWNNSNPSCAYKILGSCQQFLGLDLASGRKLGGPTRPVWASKPGKLPGIIMKMLASLWVQLHGTTGLLHPGDRCH